MTNTELLGNVSDDKLMECYHTERSVTATLSKLGISSKSKHIRDKCQSRLNKLGIKQRTRISDDKLRSVVQSSKCYSDVARQLGLVVHGGNITYIKTRLENLGVDVSHFDSISAMRRNKVARTVDEVFVVGSTIPRSSLKYYIERWLILGEERCANCGIAGEYNGKPIKCQVDHINGQHDDNRVENLRWLCPNCHSQTPTFCNRKRV